MSKVTVRGLIATTPRAVIAETGIHYTSFRLAEQREDQTTNWYTVDTKGDVAINGSQSLNKGDRVIVVGDLRIRDWDNGERSGTAVEITAVTVGHDMHYGTSTFERKVRAEEQFDYEY